MSELQGAEAAAGGAAQRGAAYTPAQVGTETLLMHAGAAAVYGVSAAG